VPANAPRVGIAAVVVDGQRVAVVLRSHAPAAGLWAFPGGRLELGEPLKEGVRREVAEECGLEVAVGELLDVVEVIEPGEVALHHWVLAIYRAVVRAGAMVASDDARDARWVTLDELARLPTPPHTLRLARQAQLAP
jgi:8-oxo-dGTP diphosphatase